MEKIQLSGSWVEIGKRIGIQLKSSKHRRITCPCGCNFFEVESSVLFRCTKCGIVDTRENFSQASFKGY